MVENSALHFAINTDFDKVADMDVRLGLCEAAGFSEVHWCEHVYERELYDDGFVERMGGLLARHGLRLLDMHAPGTADTDMRSRDPAIRARGTAILKNRIEATAALGGDSVVVHAAEEGDADLATVLAEMDEAVDCAKAHDVRIAVEAATEGEAAPYFDRYAPEVMGLCLDSGHCNLVDPPTFGLIEAFADRLCATHLHDNFGREDDHRLPFDGEIPWAEVAGMLSRIGYAKPLCLEVGRHSYLSGQYSLAERDMSLDTFVREAYTRACRLEELRTHASD